MASKDLVVLQMVSYCAHPDIKHYSPPTFGSAVEDSLMFGMCGVQLNGLLSPQIHKTIPFPEALHRFLRYPIVLWDLKPHLLLTPEAASCRCMYLTQPPASVQIFDVDFCSLWAMEPRHPRPHREPRRYRNVRTFGELIDAVKEKLEGEERLKIMKCLRIMVGVGPEEVKALVEEYGSK
ncbi:hypothetical protein AC579_1040 [Pseudocercospora musae]|uniref:Uncharacterized protein n=1 Tax=Pseudocercospora musae TaxID=113226 RepID=A0A139HNW3_9PEZI|nr:hypothetical protein AC579_1040 [Pseudocercospora musae]